MNDISNPNYEKIPHRLKEFRNRLGLKQQEFGEKIGLGQAGVSAMEKHQSDVTIPTLYRLMDLGLNPDWLLMGTGPMFYADRTDNAEATLETKQFSHYTEYVIKVPTI